MIDNINLDNLFDKAKKDQYSSFDSESNVNEELEDKAVSIYKATDIDRNVKLCDMCIKSKHTRIVKSKKNDFNNLKTLKNLWESYYVLLLSERNYNALILDENI